MSIRTGVVGAALVLIAAGAWWLGSPLFLDRTVDEEFPLAATAEVPENMTRADVEDVMAGMAKIDEPMDETMPTATSAQAIKIGTFRDADSFHRGEGRATIYRLPDGAHLLRLDDFRVTNGPDLRVLLSPHPDPQGRGDLDERGYVELGKLKGNIGNQNYEIGPDIDVTVQRSVIIYCKPFHVVFSVAALK